MKARVGALAAAICLALLPQDRNTRTSFPKDDPSESLFLVEFDVLGRAAEGSVGVEGGELISLSGYKFDRGDSIDGGRYSIRARTAVARKQRTVYYPTGFMGEPTAGVLARTRGANARVVISGAARITKLPVAREVGSLRWEDDYPSIAPTSDGGLWMVFPSYHDGRMEVGLRRYRDGQWSAYVPAPGHSGDSYRPVVLADSQDNPLVVLGGPEIALLRFDVASSRWSELEKLGAGFNHDAAIDAVGNIAVAWQTAGGVVLRQFRNGQWGRPLAIGDGWEPAVAFDSKGNAWVAWDSYRNGNYDVFLSSCSFSACRTAMAVASTPRYEARASIRIDPHDRVWVAWEQGDPLWGKDQGFTNPAKYAGTPLGGRRSVRLAVFDGVRWRQPAAAVPGETASQPRLYLDQSGHPGLLFTRRLNRYAPIATSFYEQRISWFEGGQWREAPLPHSWNRPDTRGAAATVRNGDVWAAYSTDGRTYQFPHVPIRSRLYAARFQPAMEMPELAPRSSDTVQPGPSHRNEAADVAAIRAYRTKVNRTELRILRGDTHRHTEMSYDGGTTDGSLMDFFRYVKDAASLDFGNVSDHQGGVYYDYYWWLNGKLTDLHHIPGRLTTLFGYERSVGYPHGHRNILSSSRQLRVLPFFRKVEFDSIVPGEVMPSQASGVVENDTKLLYQHIRQSGDISIPHTSGADAGTDWRDNDPLVEPVVEIFQGARTSYEQVGAPLAVPSPAVAPQSFRPDGYVHKAWEKGYRIGVIASSDHNSTHMSYAMVCAPGSSRQDILDSIRARRAYGATDNIILDFRVGDHFMGSAFRFSKPLAVRIYARGTRKLSAVRLIRNQQVIHTAAPEQNEVRFQFLDPEMRGGNYYYVRVEQEDGHLAWSSPVWVE